MANLWSSAQLLEQMLLCTLRYASSMTPLNFTAQNTL